MNLKFGKRNFYFEVASQERENVLVPLRIVMNNEILGTFQDTTYMPIFLGQLYKLMKRPKYYKNEIFKKEDFERILNDSSDNISDYLYALGESFDDYILVARRSDTKLYFAWYIREDHFFNYSSSEVNRLIYVAVTINDFFIAYSELLEWANSFLHPNYNFKITVDEKHI